jgi:hypothetical protein
MNISLPDLLLPEPDENEVWVSSRRSSNNVGPDPSRPAQGRALVEFENRVLNISFKNTFRPKSYPNEDILQLSLRLLEEEKNLEEKDNGNGNDDNELNNSNQPSSASASQKQISEMDAPPKYTVPFFEE